MIKNKETTEAYKQILDHKKEVSNILLKWSDELKKRAEIHDNSKLEEPEFSTFFEYTPKLKETEFNSPEYKDCLKKMNTALEHHYRNNRHHPEYFDLLNGKELDDIRKNDDIHSMPLLDLLKMLNKSSNGIHSMTLIDLLEMLADWYSSAKRNKNGNVFKSIEELKYRFNYSEELAEILTNTARDI